MYSCDPTGYLKRKKKKEKNDANEEKKSSQAVSCFARKTRLLSPSAALCQISVEAGRLQLLLIGWICKLQSSPPAQLNRTVESVRASAPSSEKEARATHVVVNDQWFAPVTKQNGNNRRRPATMEQSGNTLQLFYLSHLYLEHKTVTFLSKRFCLK